MSEVAKSLLQRLLSGELSPRECAALLHADPTLPAALGSRGLSVADEKRLERLTDEVRWEYAKLVGRSVPDVAYGSEEHAAYLASMPREA